MTCAKCERGNMVLVTSKQKKRTQERRGFIIWFITLPFRMIRWLYNYLFIGRDETYQKTQHWHCTYCSATQKDEPQ